MKRIIQRIVKLACWAPRSTGRAVMRRFDARIVCLVAGAVESRVLPSIADLLSHSSESLGRIEARIAAADRAASGVADEIDLVLDGLTREIFRLQAQVEMLRAGLESASEDTASVGGLSILTGSSVDLPNRRASVPPERSRVG